MPAVFLSVTSILCTVSGPVPPGSVEITVTDNGIDFVGAGNFTFVTKSTITTLSPSSGPLFGGTPVLLQGTGFSAIDKPSCSFGGVIVHAEVLSATEAMCTTPFMARSTSSWSTPLSLSVDFSSNGVDFEGDPDDDNFFWTKFKFYHEPMVSSLEPSGAVTRGDKTTVIMTGINLAQHGEVISGEDQLACRLGQDGIVEAGVVVSSTQAICGIACGNYSGSASVEVSLNDGADWTAAEVGFRCDPLPTVTYISPPIGKTAGGTTLTVTGSGFVSSSSLICLVGDGDNGATVPAAWVSSSIVKCLTPMAPGSWGGPANSSVYVSNDGVHFSRASVNATFEYVPSPTVWHVTPSFASVSASDTPVIVAGANFVNNSISSCHFTFLSKDSTDDGEPRSVVVATTFLSSTEVSCIVPGGSLPVGPTLLTVSVNGVDLDDSGALIDLEPLPEVSTVVPTRGVAGATVTPVEVSAAVV